MSDVKYIYSEINKAILYKLPIGDSGKKKRFLTISQSDPTGERLTLYYTYLNGKTVRNKRLKSIEEIADIHNAFFHLLVKNMDAVKTIKAYDDLEVVNYLVIDRECFYGYILPCMERM